MLINVTKTIKNKSRNAPEIHNKGTDTKDLHTEVKPCINRCTEKLVFPKCPTTCMLRGCG